MTVEIPNTPSLNNTTSKKPLWIILGVVLLLIAGVLIFKHQPSNPYNSLDAKTKAVVNKMPPGILLDATARDISANSSSTISSGLKDSLFFNSKKTVKENYQSYKNYCINNNWTITASTEVVTSATLTCTKAGKTMSIRISHPFPAFDSNMQIIPKAQNDRDLSSVSVQYSE